MKEKLITEFIGTYFLYLIIGLAAVCGGAGAFAPLAIGLGLTALIYASGHRSSAHFNPAVTLAFFLTKNQPAREVLPYIVIVCLAAALAAFSITFLQPIEIKSIISNAKGLHQSENFNLGTALLSEFLFTFALVWVILNVALAKGTQGNGFYALAIGFTVAAGAFSVGTLSGASFNPAVNIGLLIHQVIDLKLFVSYTLIQLLAGFLASILFNSFETKENASCSL